jgi:hypothetical protein
MAIGLRVSAGMQVRTEAVRVIGDELLWSGALRVGSVNLRLVVVNDHEQMRTQFDSGGDTEICRLLQKVSNRQQIIDGRDILIFRNVLGHDVPVPCQLESAIVPLGQIRQGCEQRSHVVPLQVVCGRVTENCIVCVPVTSAQIRRCLRWV